MSTTVTKSQKAAAKTQKLEAFKKEVTSVANHFKEFITVQKYLLTEVPEGAKVAVKQGAFIKSIGRADMNSYGPAIREEILHLNTLFRAGSRSNKISSLSDVDLAIAINTHTETIATIIFAHFSLLGAPNAGEYTGAIFKKISEKGNKALFDKHSDPSTFKDINYLSDQIVDFFKASNFGCGLLHIFPEISDPTYTRADAGILAALVKTKGGVPQLIQEYKQRAFAHGVRLNGTDMELATELAQFENAARLFDLVINKRMGTTTIIVTLLFLVMKVNYLQVPGSSSRYYIDQNMLAYFGQDNTQLRYEGSVLPRPVGELKEKIALRFDNAQFTAFDIIKTKSVKPTQKKNGPIVTHNSIDIPADGNGANIHQTMFLVLASLFVIPREVKSPLATADYESNKADAQAVQGIASILLQRYKEIGTSDEAIKAAKKSVIFPDPTYKPRKTAK